MQTPEMSNGSARAAAAHDAARQGETTTIMSAIGTVARPASTGESPRTSCRYSVLRKRNPPNAANAATEMAIADENGTDRKNRTSIERVLAARLVEQEPERQRRCANAVTNTAGKPRSALR